MPKGNVNKNPNDPRAARSVRDIKNTMLSLVEREPFAQIRVEQILSEAPVQSNTFYKYFASKQDVLDAVGDDLIARMRQELEALQPRDLRGGGNGILPYNKYGPTGIQEAVFGGRVC